VKPIQQKPLTKLFLVSASMLLFAGCGSPSATAPTGESPTATTAATTANKDLKPIRVQLAFLMQSLDAPLLLAIKKGYFAEQGLDVSFERGFGNADTISKLGTGKFDLAFSDMYNALEFNEKNPADKVIAVAAIYNKAPFSIISFKEKGINTPKDLEGKKMGAPAGDGPRKLFPVFAQATGFNADSVEWTTMEPKLRETFLLQGKVDAISGFSTSAIPALLKGGKKIEDLNVFYYTENGLDFYGNTILVKDAYAKQNPEVVKKFVAAYMKGLQDTLKDPNAGLDAVLEADQSKLMSRDAEKTRLTIALEDLFVTPEVEKNGLGAVDSARLQTTLDQTVKGFKLKTTPKIGDIFTDEFLPPKEQRAVPAKGDRKELS
jgi:NitT/TauT family transport system substrate-binding protein